MLTKKSVLNDDYIIKLGEIFTNNKWDIEERLTDELTIFDRFCKRLEELEFDEDRDFILELTENYLYLKLDKYEQHLIEVIRNFLNKESRQIEELETIHVFPIQDKEYYDKTKSGNIICYLLQGITCRRFREFHNKRIRIIETFDGVKKHASEIQMLLLVDDYIGSGDTALSCINMLEDYKISKEKIRVISLVGQNQGKCVIDDYGVNTYIAIERKKGITDTYAPEEVGKKLEQMKRISKRIKAKKDLYLGYNDSEALVSTIKTPNNTFPFYWHERKRNNQFTYAPFPRRANIGVEE